MSREAKAKMKPGAILLNTARGALVDEEAVADALESGKLAFYGADAFATEPLPPQSRLRSLPGAVLTPHIAWTTKDALQRLMDITTGNLRRFLAGKGNNIVNPCFWQGTVLYCSMISGSPGRRNCRKITYAQEHPAALPLL